MSFFKSLQNMVDGGEQPAKMPDHQCNACQTSMDYRGPHAIRTGGMNRGWGVAADVLLGARDEALFDQMTERNVLVHIFACPHCGRIEMVNDPKRGF